MPGHASTFQYRPMNRVLETSPVHICLAMQLTAVSGRLLTFKQPIVSDHAENSKSIILENVRSPSRLRYSVLTMLPPGFSSLLITPDGER